MGFAGIGTFELLVIIVLAMLVVGPHRLARTARSLGRMVRKLKEMGSEFTEALAEEGEKPKGIVSELTRGPKEIVSEFTKALTEEGEDQPRREKPKE